MKTYLELHLGKDDVQLSMNESALGIDETFNQLIVFSDLRNILQDYQTDQTFFNVI